MVLLAAPLLVGVWSSRPLPDEKGVRMKKNDTHTGRILGRRLARELTREELDKATGSALERVRCFTLTDPPDGPYRDN
jgi:hypothetical protein